MTVWELSSVLSKTLIYLGMLAAMGGMLIVWMSRGQRASTQTLSRRFVLPATFVGLLASCLLFLIQIGSVNQRGIAGMFDVVIGSILIDTEIGTALRWRLGGFMLTLLAVLPLNVPGYPFQHRQVRHVSALLMLMAAACFAMAVASLGHASAVSTLAQGLAAIHLLAIACWAGALYPLYLLVMGETASHSHVGDVADGGAISTDSAGVSASELGSLLHRFGVYSWLTLGLMLATGASLIVLLTGGLSDLLSTLHGQLLLTKIVLVAVMMLMGAVHKFVWVPRLRALADHNPDALHSVRRRLARSIRLETLLAVLVLLLTAALTTITGPAT